MSRYETMVVRSNVRLTVTDNIGAKAMATVTYDILPATDRAIHGGVKKAIQWSIP